MRRNHQQQNERYEKMMHKNILFCYCECLFSSLLFFFVFFFVQQMTADAMNEHHWQSEICSPRHTVKCVKLRDNREKRSNCNRLIYYANYNKTTCTGPHFAIAQQIEEKQKTKQHLSQWHAVVGHDVFFSFFLKHYLFNAYDCLIQIILTLFAIRHTGHFVDSGRYGDIELPFLVSREWT